MKRSTARVLLVFVAAVVLLHVALRLFGAADHTSVIAGMPQSSASYLLGPLYVLVHLAAVLVAPVVAIAAALRLGLGWVWGANCARRRPAP
jgi:hypothetical protein